jgi:hypothetical protein
VYIVESQPTFRRNMSSPSSGSKNNPTMKPARKQVESSAFTLVSYSAYSSNLKMEAISSSETPVGFQRTTRYYILEDRTRDFTCISSVPLGKCQNNDIKWVITSIPSELG